jgi:hypothetical protein
VVLDPDRRRSGAAPSHRIRPVDLYGGELAILPVSGLASTDAARRCQPVICSRRYRTPC